MSIICVIKGSDHAFSLQKRVYTTHATYVAQVVSTFDDPNHKRILYATATTMRNNLLASRCKEQCTVVFFYFEEITYD